MDDGGVIQGRGQPLAGDHEHAVLDADLDLRRLDAGQRRDDPQLVLGLKDVDRRLPERALVGYSQAEELAVPPPGAPQPAPRLRPPPGFAFTAAPAPALVLGSAPSTPAS